MPGFKDLLKLSLFSKRVDVINFITTSCSEDIKLSVVSSYSGVSFSDSTLFLFDASLLCESDLDISNYAQKIADFSICVLPCGISSQIASYVERTFKYIISIPVNPKYFRSYCYRIMKILINIRRDYTSPEMASRPVPDSFSGYFWGNSCLIRKIRGQILSAASSRAPVLILGETGTGKTTAAQVIHTLSARKEKKMVSVSLSTIVETLAESAFFGHRRGSYTNADYDCRGYFELADGSSLFLDELGMASPSIQAMLLTVLETGNYKKVGDDEEHHTDTRLIFATNADIEEMLLTGSFRQDLFFRICDNLIRIPPLRSHKEDIRGMVMHFLDANTSITEEALERLEEYSWPGNIRELHKCLNRASVNSSNNIITADVIDFGGINFPQ